MTSLQPPVVPRRHNFHKERETRNHPFDSVETTNVVIASSQLLLQIKFFFGSSSLLKRIYFFPRQGQATGQPQCTLQLLLTAALGFFYYFFLILFLNYSAQEFTSQIENKVNPKINLAVLLIKGIRSCRKADINHCCGV